MESERREQIETAYAGLRQVVDALDAEAAARRGVSGDWNAHGILAHIIRWQEEARGHLLALRDGSYERQPYDFDAFNAAAVQGREGHAWPALLQQLEAAHRAIMEVAESLPDGMWEDKRVAGWLHATTDHHYQEHLDQLRAAASPQE